MELGGTCGTIFDAERLRDELHTGLDFRPVRVAAILVRGFVVYADRREIGHVENNYHPLVKLPLDVTAREIEIRRLATNGAEKVYLFAVDVV